MSSRRYYTPYRDPQAEEARIVTYCCECGEPICEGYEFLRIGGEDYCPSCVRRYWMIAEVRDDAPFRFEWGEADG